MNRGVAAPRRWRRTPGDRQVEDKSQKDVDETLSQNRILYVTHGNSQLAPAHTLIRAQTCIFTCVWSHSVSNASKSVTFNHESTKERCVLSLHLLWSSVWCDLCLGPFNLHPAENHQEAQGYCSLSRRETQTDIELIFHVWRDFLLELGITWNTIWWLNQVVENQL